jgi:hypothetical protein
MLCVILQIYSFLLYVCTNEKKLVPISHIAQGERLMWNTKNPVLKERSYNKTILIYSFANLSFFCSSSRFIESTQGVQHQSFGPEEQWPYKPEIGRIGSQIYC